MREKGTPPAPGVASAHKLGALLERLATLIAERVSARLENGRAAAPLEDRLVDVVEAARLLGTTPNWLRRHNRLPFVRHVSRKQVRYSLVGLQRWLARRGP